MVLGERKKGGQAMMLTVLALSGTIIGTTAIVGLIMRYQIRQSTDVVNSAKAIFAADAGLEWGYYKYFAEDTRLTCKDCVCPASLGGGSCDPSGRCYLTDSKSFFKSTCTSSSPAFDSIKSIGESNNNFRAFGVSISK